MIAFELVVPCYNEAANLPLLVERSVQAARDYGWSDKEFKLILVENGSSDHSKEVMESLQAGPLGVWLKVIHVPVNQGYGFGLWQGLLATRAPLIGYTHADLQCDPRCAFKAARLYLEKTQSFESHSLWLIKGYRKKRKLSQMLVSRLFESLACIILGTRFLEINAQPKVFPRALVALLDNPPFSFSSDLYVLYKAQKAQYQIHAFEVDFPPRLHGVSSWAHHWKSRLKTFQGVFLYMLSLWRKEGRL